MSKGSDHMVVVDGRTDSEKLIELLTQSEETALEFKSSINLDNQEGKVKFVKDAVAMLNHHPGGYIIAGVDDQGKPFSHTTTTWDKLDSAALINLIYSYTGQRFEISTQIHNLNDNTICLIYLKSLPTGLPVPFTKQGDYNSSSKNKSITLFRKGDIVRRQGAQVSPITYTDWDEILETYTQQVRDSAMREINSLITTLTNALSDDQHLLPPLISEMPPSDLIIAIQSRLTHNRTEEIYHLINKCINALTDNDNLFLLCVIACLSLDYNKKDIYNHIVNNVYNSYDIVNHEDNVLKVKLLSFIYILGSKLVRLREWDLIHDLVLKPVPDGPYESKYYYASWIRALQVAAARRNLLEDKRHLIIPIARQDSLNHPGTIDDLTLLSDDEKADLLLTSLVQFDVLYALVTLVADSRLPQDSNTYVDGSVYSVAASYENQRSQALLKKISNDKEFDTALFRNYSLASIQSALSKLRNQAIAESYWANPFDEPLIHINSIINNNTEKNL